MQLTPSGEVATYSDESQFQAGHSTMKCGWYAVYQNHFAGEPGRSPMGSGADIEAAADKAYVAADGPDVASNPRGMSMQQLYSALAIADNHWQNLYPDSLPGLPQTSLKSLIRTWLHAGYPVIVAVDEASVQDMALGVNPYAWKPAPGQYTHILTLTGMQENAIDFLARDTASIGPDGVRPGPRKYASTPMELISATIFVPPWMSRPAGPTVPPAPPPPAPAPDYMKMAQQALATLNEALPHLH